MSTAERTGWDTFRALGHRFSYRLDDQDRQHELGTWLDAVLDGLRDPGARPDVVYRVASDGDQLRLLAGDEELVRWAEPGPLLAGLLWHVNQAAVGSVVDDRVVLHAAAAERDGVGVLLPAPMESGKTTTVAGLLRAGFRYLTDEAVALDPETLRAQPFAKPLSVDEGSWPVLPELAPQGLAPVPRQWQVPVPPAQRALETGFRLVVAPRYAPDRPTALQPVSRGEMVELLAVSSFTLDAHPERDLRTLARLVRGADCYRLSVRELDEAVELLSQAAAELAARP